MGIPHGCGYKIGVEPGSDEVEPPVRELLMSDGGPASLLVLLHRLEAAGGPEGLALLHVRAVDAGGNGGSRRRLEAGRRRADVLGVRAVRVVERGRGGVLEAALREAVRLGAEQLLWPTRDLAAAASAAEAEAALLAGDGPVPQVDCPLVGVVGRDLVRGVTAAWPARERSPWPTLVWWCEGEAAEPCGACGGCRRWSDWTSGQAVPGVG